MKKIFTFLLVLLLLTVFVSCNNANEDKSTIKTQTEQETNKVTENKDTNNEVHTELIEPGIEPLFNSAKCIVEGEFKDLIFEGYINPDGKKVNEQGTVIKNYYVQRYNFVVSNVFKGDINIGDTIVVDVHNYSSYDEYLNKGAKETGDTFIIESEEIQEFFKVDTTKKAILTLTEDYIRVDGDPDNMYGVLCWSKGCFSFEGDNIYKSSAYTLDIREIDKYLGK